MPVGCRYYRDVTRALDAVHAVAVATHYASCDGGVAGAGDFQADDRADLWLGDGI